MDFMSKNALFLAGYIPLGTLLAKNLLARNRSGGLNNDYKPRTVGGLINASRSRRRVEDTFDLHLGYKEPVIPREVIRFKNVDTITIQTKDRLRDLPEFLSEMPNLQILRIFNADFTEIPMVLSQIPGLKQVFFYRTSISSIDTDSAISALKNGVKLIFIGSPFKTLSDNFIDAVGLSIENLIINYTDGNSLHHLMGAFTLERETLLRMVNSGVDPEWIDSIASRTGIKRRIFEYDRANAHHRQHDPIYTLTASNLIIQPNDDGSIPDYYFKYKNAKHISIKGGGDYGRILNLDYRFRSFSRMKSLRFSELDNLNPLMMNFIPKDNLIRLDFSYIDHTRRWDDFVFDFPKLTHLGFSNLDHFMKLPPSIINLKNLKNLSFRGLPIQKFGIDMSELKSLDSIVLSANRNLECPSAIEMQKWLKGGMDLEVINHINGKCKPRQKRGNIRKF
jgi:Leucine-rich repeat (LRR) protein